MTWSFETHWENSKAWMAWYLDTYSTIRFSSLGLKDNPVITESELSKNCQRRRKKGIFSLLKPVCLQQGGLKVGLCGWETSYALLLLLLLAYFLTLSYYTLNVYIWERIKDNGYIYLNVVGFIFVKYFWNFRKGTVQNVNIC